MIEKVGPSAEMPETADEVLDLRGHVVLPGLINTHHHFYQTLTRVIPAAQNGNLFAWLKTLYPVWARITPRPLPIICTCFRMVHGSTMRSRHRKRSGCASKPREVP